MAQRGPWLLRLRKWPTANIDGDQHPIDDLAYLLRHVETLRELSLDGEQHVDLASLNQLTGLEKLTIDSLDDQTPRGSLALGNFPELHTLHLWSRIRVDWTDAPALEDVRISEPGDDDLAAIAQLTSLDVLHLDQPSRVPDLASPELRQLLVDGWQASGTTPVRGLASVAELELKELSGARDLAVLSGTGTLEFVEIIDAYGLESLAGLRVGEGTEVTLIDCPHLVDLAGIDQIPGVDLDFSGCPLLERG